MKTFPFLKIFREIMGYFTDKLCWDNWLFEKNAILLKPNRIN